MLSESKRDRGQRDGLSKPSLAKEVLLYLLNTLSASWGPAIVVGLLFWSFLPLIAAVSPYYVRHRNALLFHPLFPLQVSVSVLLGYMNARRWKSGTLYFTWLIPAISFAYAAYVWLAHSSVFAGSGELFAQMIEHFFGRGCAVPFCYDQFKFTLPLLSCSGFTMGVAIERFIRAKWIVLP